MAMRALLTTIVFAWLFVGSTRFAEADRWNSTGWVKLGEQRVNGRVDKDRINVGRQDGRFTKLTIVVEDSDLELLDFDVTFGNNQRWNPRVNHYFRENTRTRVIDLPGDERYIKHIDLKYRNVRGGGWATVAVWGWKSDGGGRAKPAAWRFDSSGWQMLGEQTVSGRVDKDRIRVGRYQGKFSKLAIVVLDSDLEMIDFAVKFSRGREWRPAAVTHYFREGSRSRIIDFPGDDRTLQYIDMKYRNLPGGGRAKVQVYGR